MYLRKAEEFEAAGDSGKLADHITEVDDQDSEHHEKCDAEPEFLADQIAEALAGDRAHAGADFLHHDQGQRNRDQRPQQQMPELRPGSRVGVDAVGIVVDVRGDKARADYGEKQHQPGLPAFQEFHASNSQTYDETLSNDQTE